MSKATSLRNKLNRIQAKYGPMAMTSYKRLTTAIGGDDLIGKDGTLTVTDTALTPQPFYQRVDEEMVGTSNGVIQLGDYKFSISADAISIADLQNAQVSLVLKDKQGREQALRIFHYNEAQLQGEYIAFEVFARSVSG